MKNKNIVKILFRITIIAFAMANCVLYTKAEEQADYQDYVNILYNSENGLPTSEANDIAQTADGFIWIASYSGLIRYDGVSFERISDENGVASANTLFIDAKNQLWIGTNDNGAMVYDNGEYTCYNVKNGLPSNSVKAICEDSKGNIYVGTTAGICMIDPEKEEVQEIEDKNIKGAYINSMDILGDDTVFCVTNSGEVYEIQDKTVTPVDMSKMESQSAIISVDVSEKEENTWFFGTEGNIAYKCTGEEETPSVEVINCGDLNNINRMHYISNGMLWICADNGVGYLDKEGKLCLLTDIQLNNSVDNMIEDFEGNLWFSSSRQGIFKCTKNYFVDINKKAGLEDNVVNAIIAYEGITYVATDTGLIALNENEESVSNEITEYLRDTRIRCMIVDEQGNLWICSYGKQGLVRYNGKDILSIGEAEGIHTSKLRSVMQASDGKLYVATADGIYIVEKEMVTSHIGEAEGLTNQEVLSLCESKEGMIYAGTDGGGVCVISDGKVIRTITEKDGLRSGIVMRIKYDEKVSGFWFITSNSIAFYGDNRVINIDKFPYSNNYDLYFGENDTIWILSSDGLYVTQRTSMLSDQALVYTFYDYNSGMPSTPTANSFSYMDEKNKILYICGSLGIYSMQMDINESAESGTKLAIPNIVVDGEVIWTKTNKATVNFDAKRIRIDAYALNYGLSNPLIEYYLEGFDSEKVRVRKSEFSDIIYTNLSGGDYTFHFSIIDPTTGEVVTTRTLKLHKNYHFTEQTWFPVMLIFMVAIVVGAIVFVAVRFRMNKLILRKEEEQKKSLTDALEMAKNANDAKTQFLSRMSHDIRTPMNAVIGISRMGLEECKEADAVDYFQKINSSGNYLLGLINDILDMSRIESGAVEFHEDLVDLKNFYQGIITMLNPLLEKRNITLIQNFQGQKVKYIYCDKLRMEQIYMNLLSNAIKYSEPGSSIEWSVTDIEVHEDRIYYKAIIKDYGCGMSEEFRKRIFEPFAQEKNKYSGETASSGLGLAICKNILDQMGGNVKVESELGVGTTFTLFLYNNISKEAPENVESMDDVMDQFEGKRILLAEDHPLNMEIAKKILEKKGILVTCAVDGREAVDRYKREAAGYFNAILMDIRMPEMDGLEAARTIRALDKEDAKTIPIIAMTANAYEEDRKASADAGMNAHLTKPIQPQELYQELGHFLKK